MGVFADTLIIIMPGLNVCGLQSKLLTKNIFLNEQKVGMLLQKEQIQEE